MLWSLEARIAHTGPDYVGGGTVRQLGGREGGRKGEGGGGTRRLYWSARRGRVA